MNIYRKYFIKKYDIISRLLFLCAQLLFTVGSIVNYYYTTPDNISLRTVILSFIDFLGALCMCLFQYRAKWLNGTIMMCIALFVSTFVFLDFLMLYI